MLALYHNAASTCSQKVRLVLDEKGLDFESREVDLIAGAQHDPEYVELNPNHVVPTLIHDERVLIESSLVNEYLDEAFPDLPMSPVDPAGRHAMRLWVKRVDELHPSAGVVTYAIGPRAIVLQQPAEVREANLTAIPDPVRRAARRSVIEHGVAAPEFAGALARFLRVFDQIETELAPDAWLSGESFGLADAAMLPYVARLDHLAMTPLIEVRPRLADWYARAKERPCFESAVRAWLPKPLLELFRRNGEALWPEIERTVAAAAG